MKSAGNRELIRENLCLQPLSAAIIQLNREIQKFLGPDQVLPGLEFRADFGGEMAAN
jgi:hypothetical protein